MDRLKQFFRKKENQILFASLALSLFLWFMVKLQKNYVTEIPFELRIANIPQGMVPKYALPSSVSVLVMGKGIDLLRLGLIKTSLWIDCQELQDSVVIRTLDNPYLRLDIPPSIVITPRDFIKPKSLSVVLEKETKRILPVKTDSDISPAPGFIVTRTIVEPESVEVVGPFSVLDQTEFVQTSKVSLENLKYNSEVMVPLLKDSRYYIKFSHSAIKMKIEVQKLGELILDNIRVEVKNIPRHYSVVPLPSTAKIKIAGGVNNLSGIKKEDIRVVVDFSEYSPGQKLKARLETDEKIVSYSVTPDEFEILVIKEGQR